MKFENFSEVTAIMHGLVLAKQTKAQLMSALRGPSTACRSTIHNITVDLTESGRRIVGNAMVEAMQQQIESYRDRLLQLGVTEIGD